MNENERDEELKAMAPHLYQWQQQKPSEEVPKDYFQNFEARLQRRLAAEQELEAAPSMAPTWQERLGRWWQQAWRPALAAALPAIALLVWWGTTLPGGSAVEPAPTFADLSTQEMDQYVEGHLHLFTSQELASILDEEVLELPALIEPVEAAPAPETSATEALDKALEQTDTENLLDELEVEDLEDLDVEDWL